MLSIARNIWLVCAENHIQLKSVHLSFEQNRDEDMLSTWFKDKASQRQFEARFRNYSIYECQVSENLFRTDDSI